MKKTKEPFMIGGQEIELGERAMINLPLPRLYTHSEITMPIQVIRGKKDGPCLFVSAAVHGDEINGVEIIRRLLKVHALKRLQGTLVVVPVVNVFGFVNHSRYLPDRRDLNRSFPGSIRGSMTGRLARVFMDEIVRKCTHGIDLHSGSNNRSNLPQVRACMDHPETARLVHAFGLPFVLNASIRDGSLREAVRKSGIPILVYEGGEALRFDEVSIRVGLRGILSVMRALKMLPPLPTPSAPAKIFVARNSLWIRSPVGGILTVGKPLGGIVSKDEVIGWVGDPFGENNVEVKSPIHGLVIGRTNIPLVNEGDPLFHIASIHITHSGTALLKKFQSGLDPDFYVSATLGPPPVD
jgi:uncharacterized protein